MSKINRREFMMGCSAAIAAMSGAQLNNIAFAEEAKTEQPLLLTVFLRGGWDALNVILPIDGDDRGHYEAARPSLKISAKGKDSALRLNDQFGLHPAMSPLLELFQAKHLALVTACGMPSDTRSHFDAMEFMELGTPGLKVSRSGWLARSLASLKKDKNLLLAPAMSADASVAESLLGTDAFAVQNPNDFQFWADEATKRELSAGLRRLYAGDTWLHDAGNRTLRAVQTLQSSIVGEYKPGGNAKYPDGPFGDSLKTIARLAKQDMGLEAATVDLGGWDTHQYQGDGAGGYFADLLTQLSRGLQALYLDLDAANKTKKLAVVVMSEFGRRVQQNSSGGTDHGHGSAMLVLGGSVRGGMYGRWPGLKQEQLYDRADLAVTTDYRQVLSEVIVSSFAGGKLDQIFPGFKPSKALGLMG